MTVRIQTMLVIAGTLLVGGLIGSLVTSSIASARMEQLYKMRTPEGFVQTMEEVVQPQDDAQRAQVRQVLTRTTDDMGTINQACHSRPAATMDSMRVEMAAILDPEQRTRLDAWFQEHWVHHERLHRQKNCPERE